MTTWHRTDRHGTPVAFSYEPDERGNVTLTPQEVEGLLRTGGWTPGPHPGRPTTTLQEQIAETRALIRADPDAARHFAHALSRR